MDLSKVTIKIQIKGVLMRNPYDRADISASSFSLSREYSSQQDSNQMNKGRSVGRNYGRDTDRSIESSIVRIKKFSASQQNRTNTSSLSKKYIPKKRSQHAKLLKEMSKKYRKLGLMKYSILQKQQSSKKYTESLSQTILQEHKLRKQNSKDTKELLSELYLSVEDKFSEQQRDYFSRKIIEQLEMPKNATFQSQDPYIQRESEHQTIPGIITPKLKHDLELGLDEVERIHNEALKDLVQPPIGRRFRQQAIKSQEEMRINPSTQTLKGLHSASQHIK